MGSTGSQAVVLITGMDLLFTSLLARSLGSQVGDLGRHLCFFCVESGGKEGSLGMLRQPRSLFLRSWDSDLIGERGFIHGSPAKGETQMSPSRGMRRRHASSLGGVFFPSLLLRLFAIREETTFIFRPLALVVLAEGARRQKFCSHSDRGTQTAPGRKDTQIIRM